MRTVLIVDDHTDTTAVLVELVRQCGWDAVGVSSAEEAIQLARSVRFDLVVADLLLPGMDGEALERTFAADTSLSGIPFVLITGFDPAAQRLGPGRVLVKPFSPTDLIAAMDRAVRSAEAPTWTQTASPAVVDADVN